MQKYKTVDDFLNDLDTAKRQQVEALRSIIVTANSSLKEHIKWNAPSYVLDGEDRVTFNTMNKQGVVKLVLHMGATRKEVKKDAPILHDSSGLVEWSSDIRGMLTFDSIDDVNANANTIKEILTDWLAIPSAV